MTISRTNDDGEIVHDHEMESHWINSGDKILEYDNSEDAKIVLDYHINMNYTEGEQQ